MTEPGEDLVPNDHLDPDERDIEAPADDAVEQATAVYPTDEQVEVHRGLEVDEWDALEQAHIVDVDEEYR
jgi:hypothetical protein